MKTRFLIEVVVDAKEGDDLDLIETLLVNSVKAVVLREKSYKGRRIFFGFKKEVEVKSKKQNKVLYVCYEIVDGSQGTYDVDECESFTTLAGATKFMKENYARYVMTIENCDDDVFKEVKRYEPK